MSRDRHGAGGGARLGPSELWQGRWQHRADQDGVPLDPCSHLHGSDPLLRLTPIKARARLPVIQGASPVYGRLRPRPRLLAAQVALRAGHDPSVAGRFYTGNVAEADRRLAEAVSGLLSIPEMLD